jgi:hypothetical protein
VVEKKQEGPSSNSGHRCSRSFWHEFFARTLTLRARTAVPGQRMFSGWLPSIAGLRAQPDLLQLRCSSFSYIPLGLLLLRLALAAYLVKNARTIWSSAPLPKK